MKITKKELMNLVKAGFVKNAKGTSEIPEFVHELAIIKDRYGTNAILYIGIESKTLYAVYYPY